MSAGTPSSWGFLLIIIFVAPCVAFALLSKYCQKQPIERRVSSGGPESWEPDPWISRGEGLGNRLGRKCTTRLDSVVCEEAVMYAFYYS